MSRRGRALNWKWILILASCALGLLFIAVPMLMMMVLMGSAVETAGCGTEGATPSPGAPTSGPTHPTAGPSDSTVAPIDDSELLCAGFTPVDGAILPLSPTAAYVDQRNYGNRGQHWESSHTGTDLSTACGTDVLAATGGTINVRTDQPWAGDWLVEVRTGPGSVTTSYAHMERLLVHTGEVVALGQVIGAVGQKGNATGCHLHFEVHPTGDGQTVDPSVWLAQNAGVGQAVS